MLNGDVHSSSMNAEQGAPAHEGVTTRRVHGGDEAELFKS